MADSIGLIDAETLAALKVLRGDNKKNDNAVDKEFTSGLAQQIVDALSAQKDSSSTQTAKLIEAVREQTAILKKLTDLLETKQKTTVVVVNKDNKGASSSDASTAAETELETVAESGDTEDEETAALVAAAVEAASKAEEETTTPTPVVEKKVAETPPVFRGPWGFVESKDATERRSRVSKTNGSFRYLAKGEEVPEDAFVPVTNAQKLEKGDALFGKVSGGEQLIGDSFGKN